MKVGYLGAGVWGFTLAALLAKKGYEVVSWSTKPDLVKELNDTKRHPLLPEETATGSIRFTTELEEVLEGVEFLAEAVTSEGIRPVFTRIREMTVPSCPIVITSKGIEQNTGLLLPEVVAEVLGEERKHQIGILSGPSFAKDLVVGLPTSVVGSAYNHHEMMQICNTFSSPNLRVYPNIDIQGVAFGGALKNIIAIACGICEGLELGLSCRAAVITRGLHEMRKLAVARGCKSDTLNGLSGLGDLCLTCSSVMSRNYRFGTLLAQGVTGQDSKKTIGMVVEGAYTCVSALQLSREFQVPMPITEGVYKIIYENLSPAQAIDLLMQRDVKEEHL